MNFIENSRNLNGLKNINISAINGNPISSYLSYPTYYRFFKDPSTGDTWSQTLSGISASNLILHLENCLTEIPSDYIISLNISVSFSNYSDDTVSIRRVNA